MEISPKGLTTNKGVNPMQFKYYPETDSLYISLSPKTSVDSQEVAPDVVLDFGENGQIVGIDIDHASQVVDLSRLETESLPISFTALAK
jgi:uncharacterized protein YuzE